LYKILVIDDNEENLYLIDEIVKKHLPDSKVILNKTGKEGIISAVKEQPDVILLDLMMPEMDGFQTCQKIKSDIKTKHIPLIIISGIITKAESKIKALELGADAFLSKPIGAAELIAQIKAMIRIKISEDKLRDETIRVEEEKKYKDLLDNINCFICTHDLEGEILSVNTAAENLLGYPKEEIIGKNFRRFLAPEVQAQFDDYMQEIKSTGKSKGLLLIQTANGDKRVWKYDNTLCEEKGAEPFVRGFANDITELKQKAHLLKISEKKYKDLFEKSDDAMLIIKNGRFVDCNRATVKMLRYKNKKELLNTHPSVLSPEFQPDGRPSFEKADEMMKLAFEKGSHRFEWEHKKADGEIFPVEVLLTAITIDENEKILHTVWRDITDRKIAEKKLKDSEQTYRSLFEDSADGMFLMSDVFIDCNQSVCKLFRCSKEEIIGKSPVDFSPEVQPDGQNSFLSASEKIEAAYNGIPQRFYWKHKTKDNVLFDAEVTLNRVFIENKNLIQAVVRDITEQKKTERIQNAIYRISESAYTAIDMYALYKKIHEIISTLLPVKNIYIALYDDETELLSFPYFVDEYDPQQPAKKLGKGLTEYVLRTGKACLVNEKKDLELRASGEVEIIGEPTKIWLGVPLKISGKTIGVIVLQDYDDENAYGEDEKQLLIFVSEQIAQVIERKQNSVQLKEYAQKLKEANLTKDKFISIIAHDLKSPFQGLLGYSQILTTEYSSLPEEEKLFFIKSIDEISKNAFSLLEDLLTWSRLQTGKMEVNLETFNLLENLSPTISLLEQTALNKEIKLICSVDKQITVNADKNMLCTIIRNLISNGIKFTNKGGTISLTASADENFVKISVEDTGVGIDEDRLLKLFSIDKSLSTRGTADEEGTGLGLLLCKEMVEKQGGEIHVESTLGEGSKFTFNLPAGK